MAQQYTSDKATFIIPGAYPSWEVKAAASGLAASGILFLVGEAEMGPDFSREEDLALNAYGPDQDGDVVAKYRSGPLVDAFKAACQPANDPSIQGAPNRIVLVKTNASTKSKVALLDHNGDVYAYLADKSYGKLGNLIYASVTEAQAEVAPTTGAFTFIPPVGTVAYSIRVNGGASVGGTLAAGVSPDAVASALDAHAGVDATGGEDRVAHPAAGNISLTVISGNAIQIDVTTAWATTPTAGDTLVIPATSVIAGASDENVGAYVVTSATSTQVLATKLSDAGMAGAVPGTITAPVTVASVALSGTPADDVVVYAPVLVSVAAGDPIAGVGKSLEFASLTTGTDLLERCAFQLGTTSAVSWVSKDASPKVLTSAAEYVAQLNVARALDSQSQELVAGGEVALKLGYKGTTASVSVDDRTLDITVTGGDGVSLSLDLADYPTLNDLATFINSQTGFTCAVGNGILGSLPSTALDDVNTSAASTHGAQVCRLKVDAYKLFKKVSEEAVLVELQDANGEVVQAAKGLPAPQDIKYLAGGTRGSTSNADIQAALEAMELVRGNFVVPLFSRDAIDDIADGLTDPGSTYTIASIHALTRTHVLTCSQIKRRKPRQAILSIQSSFADARETASNIANFRCLMTFQDVKTLGATGSIEQFQPWMAAVNAAAMQAAGFYRPIVNKVANLTGALQAAGDFDDRNNSDLENALLSGLLPMKRLDEGGYAWVSDQTTYGKDNNFVYNSLQAVYMADLMSATLGQRMEAQFTGQSVADVSAALALSALETILGEFLRLKMIAPSSDAPKGYKNVKIRINGPVMVVSLELKIAGAIYFIPIDFVVSQVSQSASA